MIFTSLFMHNYVNNVFCILISSLSTGSISHFLPVWIKQKFFYFYQLTLSVFILISFWSRNIAGNEGLSQWLEDPTYPNITLSWQLIHGEMEKWKCVWSVCVKFVLTTATISSQEMVLRSRIFIRLLVTMLQWETQTWRRWR